jgi:HPt (histidine-containing phosphotransfer) domain-containing protein
MGEYFDELIPAFIESTENMVKALPIAVQEHDSSELIRLVHSIKSASANVGAMRLSALAKEMEALARAEELNNAETRIAQLEMEFIRVRAALENSQAQIQ